MLGLELQGSEEEAASLNRRHAAALQARCVDMWAESDVCRYLSHAGLKDRNPSGLQRMFLYLCLHAQQPWSRDGCEAARHLLAADDGA